MVDDLIASCQERLRGQVFAAGVIGDDRDPSPVPDPALSRLGIPDMVNGQQGRVKLVEVDSLKS
jgi:hypothetical protein